MLNLSHGRYIQQKVYKKMEAQQQEDNHNRQDQEQIIPQKECATSQVTLKGMPKKRFFRSRAHCNPLSHNDSFAYPMSSFEFDWSSIYPNIPEDRRSVSILDIGMGFGGLTVALAEIFPDKLVLGMEIRAKVCEYVRLRIESLRKEFPGQYQNAGCYRTNCMRYFANFFLKGQLDKIFICFPDPHFKAKNHRRRIISTILLSEYAYFLRPGGRLYTITDVKELYEWHVAKCDAHPYFNRIDTQEGFLEADPAAQAMANATEESKKVTRMGGQKHVAIYERVIDNEPIKKRPKLSELLP